MFIRRNARRVIEIFAFGLLCAFFINNIENFLARKK